MSRRSSSKSKEAKTNGCNVQDAKSGGTPSSLRSSQRELASVGSINRRSETQAEAHNHLHQLIAERAYVLYERSGFQDGHDLEHWLEAERQIKTVRDQAA